MRSPIIWFGGKGNMQAKLLPMIPYDHIYCEPFGGGASILLGRKTSPVEVYNDLDSGLYDFFTVLADPELFKQFHRRVEALPCSRQLYNEYRTNWKSETDKTKRVAMWFLIARQSFGGDFSRGWGYNVSASWCGMSGIVSSWITAIKGLSEVHARLQRVQIENNDFRKVIDTYDTNRTVFYVDPPYVTSTRKSHGYKHEMTDQDHTDLIDILLDIKGSAVLSGYSSDMYDRLESNGWNRKDFETACYAAARTRQTGIQGKGSATKKQPRVESVWSNPKAQRLIDTNLDLWKEES